uniref:POU-specific domain-containing protein n=1 Tax=Leptobrachium leishanense TaxID=445787 RepID=A0A8C5PM68_9ANUR
MSFVFVSQEAITMEVQKLAWEIRQRRGVLGLTQQDVGVGLGAVYGTIISQTTICRFEAGELSLDNMVKLMPKIETFLELHEKKGGIGESALNPPTTVRKKTRTVFPSETIQFLEGEYRRCKLPNKEDLDRIAGMTGLEKKVSFTSTLPITASRETLS